MACAIIGDSIAVGVAHFLPQCTHQATVGITAERYSTQVHKHNGLVIISLGSNLGANDEAHLREVRSKQSGSIVWLLPAVRDRNLIRKIAAEYGDRIVDVRDGGAGFRHIHPNGKGYERLAHEIIR